MSSTITPWRSVLTIGALECVWLGMCMVLSPFYNVAPGLFKPIDATYVIPIGVVCLLVGVFGFLRPNMMGGGALVLVCGVRITQAIAPPFNLYPMGVWICLIVALALTYFRFRTEKSEGSASFLRHLDRRARHQAEESDRQTQEGDRQTAEGDRQTREGERQTHEGERQTLEGDRLRTLRADIEDET